jgi:hypothetical protein
VTYAPKIVLELPLSEQALLEPFVEACMRDLVRLIAIVGEDASKFDDLIDEIVVAKHVFEGAPECLIVTSFHVRETLEEVIEFAEEWEVDRGDPVQVVKL